MEKIKENKLNKLKKIISALMVLVLFFSIYAYSISIQARAQEAEAVPFGLPEIEPVESPASTEESPSTVDSNVPAESSVPTDASEPEESSEPGILELENPEEADEPSVIIENNISEENQEIAEPEIKENEPIIFVFGSETATQEEIEEILASSALSDLDLIIATSSPIIEEISALTALSEKNPGENVSVASGGLETATVDSGELLPLASWVIGGEKDAEENYLGIDDDVGQGSQFLPSGKFQVDKEIAVCTAFENQEALPAVSTFFAEIFYPENIAFDLSESSASAEKECGKSLGKIMLEPITKQASLELFCNRLRNYNNNLPYFAFSSQNQYNYEDLCSSDGAFSKEASAIYCSEVSLSYSDPAGDYKILFSQSDESNQKIFFTSHFRYLEHTSFEADFSELDYGPVKLNVPKPIIGDLEFFSGDGKPTVRNIGNTRMSIVIKQNDMELGKTGDNWNIKYQTSVGSSNLVYGYNPGEEVKLDVPLDLGDIKNVDFSIMVLSFPSDIEDIRYAGNLTLSAEKENYFDCADPKL